MGGDTGPAVMLAGAARAHGRRDDLQFLVFGDKARIASSWTSMPG
jgi:fatty acid/phospholipid biosynthesis enzyme